MDLPSTIAFTRFEGGTWERFYAFGVKASAPREHPYTVHSILFDDGSIWDSVNGWRPDKDLELVAIQRALS